jgi:alkanesulfonate monooxygenase SsuD/methylene tetrahydromethanopterin reductase-like flavin-dependent oxidoreductase (luciferase family)
VALRRAGRLADGYHSSATSPETYGERLPTIRAAAEEAGRAMPALSARVRVEFGPARDRYYAMRGTSDDVAAEVRKFAALGVADLALSFVDIPGPKIVAGAERFAAEVAPLV